MTEIRTDEWWRKLANYESSDLVKAQFKAIHNRQVNTAKAQEICASVTQARSYMEAAHDANRNVRPLLLYYGVLGLSRALTLFLSISLRETSLSQAHGLSANGWVDELGRTGGSISALKITLNKSGTLQQLMEATGHKSHLRSGSSVSGFAPKFALPSANSELEFAALLSRIPEIREPYSRWRPTDRNLLVIWHEAQGSDDNLQFQLTGYSEDEIRAVMGDIVTVLKRNGENLTILVPKENSIYWSDTESIRTAGTPVAMKPFSGDIRLSKIAITFVAAYALGMLARYYPSQWTGILNNQRHTSALPSLLAAMDYVAKEFPRMVVEFLEPPSHLTITKQTE